MAYSRVKVILFKTRATMLPNLRFLTFAIVIGGLLTPSPGAAQPQSDTEKMERLERQVELLQKQLKAVQDEIKVTKKRAERWKPRRRSKR